MSCPKERPECPGLNTCNFYEAPDICWYPKEAKVAIAERKAQESKKTDGKKGS